MSAALIADKLRASLLQAAIQGKLTKQLAEDGDARDLLKEIEAEKARLIEEKVIKKEKPLLPITDEEIPFEIPENWVWVRLGDLFSVSSGRNLTKKDMLDNGSYPVYGGNGVNGYYNNYLVEKNTLVIGRVGFYCGATHKTASQSWVTDNALIVSFYLRTLHIDFFLKVLNFLDLKHTSVATAQPVIAGNRLYNVLCPLPPLAEQHRIVEAIETALAKIDKLKADETKLYDIQKAFPNKLRASLLQSAIQGRLTEQLPEDGNALELLAEIEAEKARLIEEKIIKKEKPLPPITEEEIPFEIPENWAWVRFGSIVINRDAERIPLSKDERSSHKKIYDYYGASGVIDQVNDFIFDEELLLIGEDGANLLTRSKPIAFIANGKYWVNNHAHVLQPCIDIRYLAFYINAIPLHPYVTGTAQPKMNQEKMNSILVSIPPLAEQERIVKKLDEILGKVDELKRIAD